MKSLRNRNYNIVVSGPESVGKSTLVKHLGLVLPVQWTSEYARSYIESLNRHYSYADVEKIAKFQWEQYLALNEEINKVNVFDTFLIITKVWFLHVFQKFPSWVDESISRAQIDLYLLCRPDLPWVKDGVRESENIREYLFERYLEEIKYFGFNYKIIEGVGEKRMQNAEICIKELLCSK